MKLWSNSQGWVIVDVVLFAPVKMDNSLFRVVTPQLFEHENSPSLHRNH